MPKVSSVAALKIGKRIRSVRRSLGISLEDLGELSEISWTSIGKIERGASSPTAESLVRLATALEIDPGIFLTGIVADDYGVRAHRFTVRDLIRGREQQRSAAEARATANIDDDADIAEKSSTKTSEAATQMKNTTPEDPDESVGARATGGY